MLTETKALPPRPVAVRGCDGCTLCCKVFTVHELAKPGNKWCPHCTRGTGCGIYERRPVDCATFQCGYLTMAQLGPEWKPALSHLIISSEFSSKRLNVHVDQGRPDAWRKQPYYGTIKDWNRQALPRGEMVIVMIGMRCIVPLPDRDVDLGVMRRSDLISIGERLTANGIVYDAFVTERDSALGQRLEAADGAPVMVPDASNALRTGRTIG